MNLEMATNTNLDIKRKCDSLGQESVDSWSLTEVEEESFSHLWTIRNYSAFIEKGFIESPIFLGGLDSQHKWQLKIKPKTIFEEQEWFGAFLYFIDFGDGNKSVDRAIKARYQITLLDEHDRTGKHMIPSIQEFKKPIGWGLNKFLLSSQLSSLSLLVDDKLKVHCKVWIQGDVNEKAGKRLKYNPDKSERILMDKEECLKDFVHLLQSTEFADVALNTQTKTFMAHKNVLACRSTVFAAMFSNNMLESSLNTVEIPDFDEDIVEEMLKYMYSGETKSLTTKASDLLQISEKYNLTGLKLACEHSLADNLSVNTAAEVLILAKLHNAHVLKPKVINFINRNKEKVRKTTTFQNLSAEVLMELYISQ